MAQQATNIPPKGLWTLKLSDFWKGLFLSAITNLLLALYPIINAGNWPTHADFMVMIKSTVALMLAYLIKNFSTNNTGQLFTKDKPVVSVDADQAAKAVVMPDYSAPNDSSLNKK